jgi:uncharacterized membrane protein
MATDVQTANQPAVTNEPSMTGLVTGILHDVEQLFKQQVVLFKHEVREDLHRSLVAGSLLIGGGVVAALGVFVFFLGLPLLLTWATEVPLWASFLIVGTAILVLGLVVLYAGKKKFDSFNPLPDQTAEALKENVQWIMKPK